MKPFIIVVFSLLMICLSFQPASISATSVDRMSLCNLEGSPGKTIDTSISLTGTDADPRTGYWDIYYKQTEDDSEKMDISSWITIEPKEYTIAKDEIKNFTVHIKVPKNASPGLWGATSIQAGEPGQSVVRRTYILFKDAGEGGNVFSGLLIPVSVKVQGSINPFTSILDFFKDNMIVVLLVLVILILAILLIIKTRHPKTSS
jgi:hypothetical protein